MEISVYVLKGAQPGTHRLKARIVVPGKDAEIRWSRRC